MAGMMTAFVGSGGILTISITAATASNGGTPTYYFYGYNGVAATISNRQYIPLVAMGAITGSPTFNGAAINGVYSSSVVNTSTATSYIIVLDGNRSLGFVTGLVINGTAITPLSTGRNYDAVNNQTALYFDVTGAGTLFTATSTVGIY